MAVSNNTTKAQAWAVVDSSLNPICEYTSIGSIDAEFTASAPAEPIEGGTLAAYNKTREPERVVVSLLFRGDVAAQNEALAKLDELAAGTELCAIYTPAKIWRRMTLERYDFSRAQGAGASLLEASCSFVEVRAVNVTAQTAAASYSPRKATSAEKQNTGKAETSALQETVNYLKS